MILLHLLVLIAPSYGLFCEPRWTLFENSCYKRFESATPHNTCRTFRSLLLQNVTASEVDFIAKITLGKPMANGTGDFVCKKNAVEKEVVVTRTRPLPRNDLDCAGKPNWFGLSDTKRCYSMQFNHYPFTYDEANARCQNWFNGTLATMRTEAEYNQVIRVAHFGTYGLTFEQPLVGYRRTSNQWRWIGGSQEGITKFHGGIPDPKLNLNCAQLTTDITILPDHQVVYNAQFGSMVPVPCDQRFQRYVCSVDHATFLRKFPAPTTTTKAPTTTVKPTTTTTVASPELYCPPRWIHHEEGCYRAAYIRNSSLNYDCSTINGTEFSIPANSSVELFQKFETWKEQIFLTLNYHVCYMPATPDKPDFDETLPNPTSDFDCLAEGWYGLAATDSCYKLFSDLENMYTFAEANAKCEELGGLLATYDTVWDNKDFIWALSHTGVPAFITELPALSNDFYECARFGTEKVLDDYLDMGFMYSGRCALTNSYICEVSLDEMELRYA